MKMVVVLISGLRYDHLMAYGNKWLKLPNIDRLSECGLVFDGICVDLPDPLYTRFEMFSGLSGRRFKRVPIDIYREENLLFGILRNHGVRTAIFSTNAELKELYSRDLLVDYMYFNIPRLFMLVSGSPDTLSSDSTFREDLKKDTTRDQQPLIITGQNLTMPSYVIEEYERYRERMVKECNWPLDALVRNLKDWLGGVSGQSIFAFLDIGCFLGPWLLPDKPAVYRRSDDLGRLAWPLFGRCNPEDKLQRKEIEFLRRTYADMCIYLDATLGSFLLELTENGFDVVLMSDFGILIGDRNFIGVSRDIDSPVLHKGIFLYCPAGAIAGSKDLKDLKEQYLEKACLEKGIVPACVFTTILARFGCDEVIATDGYDILGSQRPGVNDR